MPKIRAGNLAEHRTLTWNALLDSFDALLDERGYEAISLSDVATRAGMARNTIYNYVDDKAGLLAAAFERSGRSLSEEIGRIAEDRDSPAAMRLSNVVRLLLVSFASGTRRLLLLHDVSAALPAAERAKLAAPFDAVRTHVLRIVVDGIDAGQFAPVADAELTFELMVGTMHAAVLRVVRAPGTADATAEVVTPFLLNALRSESE
ncbi:TetR/AcrR family transcriptional regulator [Nonomuraea insulae]|uniref:TetR/AcrR family transcriptional regulator n=1 Tax=Nonomuraea insulae TaxID=1616787 RepID=A0ABW1CKQ2_9ACTN